MIRITVRLWNIPELLCKSSANYLIISQFTLIILNLIKGVMTTVVLIVYPALKGCATCQSKNPRWQPEAASPQRKSLVNHVTSPSKMVGSRWWVQNGGRRKEKKRIDSIKRWTWNLLIRSQAPYPFGHRVIVMLRRRHSEVLILEPSVYETDVIFTSLPCHDIKKKIKTFTWKRNERIWTS